MTTSLALTVPSLSSDQFLELTTLARTSNSPLIPIDTVRQALVEMASMLEPATNDDAVKITALLIGSYPRHVVDDPEIYTRAMKSVMAKYPRAVGFAAVDALTLKCKFIPTRAELFEELERQVKPLREAQASARWMANEHARRKAEAENERAIEASKAAFRAKHGGKSPLEVLGAKFSAEEPKSTTTEE